MLSAEGRERVERVLEKLQECCDERARTSAGTSCGNPGAWMDPSALDEQNGLPVEKQECMDVLEL